MKLVYKSRHYVYNLKSNIAREYTSGIHVYQFSIQRVYIISLTENWFQKNSIGILSLRARYFFCTINIGVYKNGEFMSCL